MHIEIEIGAPPAAVWNVSVAHSNALSGASVPWFLQDEPKAGTAIVGKTYKYRDVGVGPRTVGFRFLSIVPGEKLRFLQPNAGLARSIIYNEETSN